ncbi:right-handed parallel beta-helix repeat-containing protein [Paraflavitalea soli]|uniref:Right-handed parallel beta-helix repeat-containing protein n=1 Tax=Paraflavitalea soli TaxID=2315862 RepID=A0A3B7MRA6_9BACT|nr:right-handed parallel beta-helix repeat-containing protein [Paraflavitalea soli]AXY75883.1 right-handed parallel beta-helix repeat-containing protein [Paraflavitalea soli]
MKYLSLLVLVSVISVASQAKSWRVNNNVGVVADFTSLGAAINSATVASGDTVYVEPSATKYDASGAILGKKLVVIGPGYFLDPANTTTPGNPGLQVVPYEASVPYIYVTAGGKDSKFIGMNLDGVYLRAASNLVFERCRFTGTLQFEQGASSNITVRKCFFNSSFNYGGVSTASNLICENNIFAPGCVMNLPMLTGSGNIVRNNTFYETPNGSTIVNAYFVNNIVGSLVPFTLTDCTIKNNLFKLNQPLPATATNNQVNVNMLADVYMGTGSYDGKMMLKATSLAKGAGLTVGSVVNPDCGAFGATDPYVLSGIPNVPTIYTFTAPTSIPSGSATMNVTFSTRNNN